MSHREASMASMGSPSWRVALARAHQKLGLAGVVGLVGILLAAGVWMSAWFEDRRVRTLELALGADEPVLAIASPPSAPAGRRTRRLSSAADIPEVLGRIERSLATSGLSLPAAEYATVAADGNAPARLEVRFAVRAPYPIVRAGVRELLASVPFATFKELSFSRAGADALDVDAKIAVIVYLSGDVAADEGGPAR
jgi:hypothetical protein